MSDPWDCPEYHKIKTDNMLCEHGQQTRKCPHCEAAVGDIIIGRQGRRIKELEEQLCSETNWHDTFEKLYLDGEKEIKRLRKALKESCEENRSTLYICPLEADNERLREYHERNLHDIRNAGFSEKHRCDWRVVSEGIAERSKAVLKGDKDGHS